MKSLSALASSFAFVISLAHAAQGGEGQPVIAPHPVGGPAWQRYVDEGRNSPFGLDYVFVLDREFRKPELARFPVFLEPLESGT